LSTVSKLPLFPDLLDGRYDCVDRVVLRAYFRFGQHPAGFRVWWRRWQGWDAGLDNAHLMRSAGRFARRVRAWASERTIPLVFASAGERKEEISAEHGPKDADFEGVFLNCRRSCTGVGMGRGSDWRRPNSSDSAQAVLGQPLRISHPGARVGTRDRSLLSAPTLQRAGHLERSRVGSGAGSPKWNSISRSRTIASPRLPTPQAWMRSQRP
jgi:hypothetical protein